MSGSTCPDWCDQHSRNEDSSGAVVDSHVGSLWTKWLPFLQDAEGNRGWTFWLYVRESNVSGAGEYDGHHDPGLVLQEYGCIPRTLDPEAARAMAAALIRGAEIVEASLTARCAVCDQAVGPSQADECTHCQIQANITRRQRLQVVV